MKFCHKFQNSVFNVHENVTLMLLSMPYEIDKTIFKVSYQLFDVYEAQSDCIHDLYYVICCLSYIVIIIATEDIGQKTGFVR